MIDVKLKEQKDKRLGRQMVHDEKSRSFPMKLDIDPSTWKTKVNRVLDPLPNPQQPVGCCTGVAKVNQFNTFGNRAKGRSLGLTTALEIYSRATQLDPWEGVWPPDDTGSSGLASAKAAQQLGLGAEYRWLFGGADEVVQAIMNGETISVGTWWHEHMFNKDRYGLVKVGGGYAGGHQYIARGYNKRKDWVMCRCWWGPDFKDFYIARQDLNELLLDDGDAHWQKRAGI